MKNLTVSLCLLFVCGLSVANEYQTDARVVAIGDIHGSYEQLNQILSELGLINISGDWTGADTYLISLGDIVGRGTQSRKVMDLLMQLQAHAPDTGGKVLQLLGNHEVMLLADDFQHTSRSDFSSFADGVSPEQRDRLFNDYQQRHSALSLTEAQSNFDKGYPYGYTGFVAALAKEGTYGQWLRKAATVIKINDTVFVHGGLSSELFGKSVDEINQAAREVHDYQEAFESLVEQNVLSPLIPFAARETWLNGRQQSNAPWLKTAERLITLQSNLAFSSRGPMSYLGSAKCHPLGESFNTERLLQQLGAKRFVVGHTQLYDQVTSRINGHVILIDTGMIDNAGSALIIDKDDLKVHYLGADQLENIKRQQPTFGVGSDTMTDAELEEFLLTATVTDSKPIGLGVTKSSKITLEKDGVLLYALFKTFDSNPGRYDRYTEEDRYQNELAAYKVDRLLGLHLVPAAVERTIDGDTGLVQLWLQNVTNQTDLTEKNLPFVSPCERREQYRLRYVFDILIYNTDRNTGNFVFTNDEMMMYLIDHSISFYNSGRRPKQYSKVTLEVSGLLEEKLTNLTPQILRRELSGLLHRHQISAIIRRRNLILKQATRP